MLTAGPRHRSRPPERSNAGQEAIELAELAGLTLDPWQAEFLVDSLGETEDGRWSSLEVALIVGRQNGKGAVLEARELAGLFLFGEQLIMHSAHEHKTALEGYLRIKQLIQTTPDLDRKVRAYRGSHGEEGIDLKSGARLKFVARSKGSGRGFSGDTIILDEAYNLSNLGMSAMFPTMAARPNPQIWYTSSAPLPESCSDVLRRLIRRGREGSDRLTYAEFCAAPDCDLDDPVAWREANPGMGYRIDENFVRAERAALSDEDFARERLGLWLDIEASRDVFGADNWAACLNPQSKPGKHLAFAIDATPDGSHSSICASDGTHVEVIEHRRGTGWVVERLLELIDRHEPVAVGCDPKGAGRFLADLPPESVQLLSVAELSQAATGLTDAVADGRVAHIGQHELDLAIAGAAKRSFGDTWVWSRRSSAADISPLVGITVARWLALTTPEAPVSGTFLSWR